MHNIKKQKIFSFSCLILLVISSSVFATTKRPSSSLKNFEFSAAGGINWLHADNTHLTISPYETDSNKVRQTADAPLWKLGAGYYVLEDNLNKRKFLNHLLLELNVYHTSATVHGNVWQYQLPQFNNYSFRAPISSTRLMLDVKPSLFTYCRISPYVVLGVGAARNTASYNESVTGAGVDPTSFLSLGNGTNINIAYDLGAGLKADITKHLSASLEYLYASLGNVSPANSSTNLTALMTSSKFAIQSQSVLLGISWKI